MYTKWAKCITDIFHNRPEHRKDRVISAPPLEESKRALKTQFSQ